jgi:hypothetical protein
MEQPVVKNWDDQEKPILIWGVHDVLIKPTADDLSFLPACLTPKILERDLIKAVGKNTTYTNAEAAQHRGKLPIGIKAWLLDREENKKMITITRENISLWSQPILYAIVGETFTPKSAASYQKPIKEVVALALACKQQGYRCLLASSWNSACFAEIEAQHPSIFEPFEQVFTSGKPGNPGSSTKLNALSSEQTFFEQIKNSVGRNRSYTYLDAAENEESITSAQETGITPIAIPEATDKEKALKLKLQLVEYGILPE